MNLRLGQAHHSLGQYSRAVDALRKNVELLADLLHDPCYMAGLPSVFSRAWLGYCLAERGEFGEAQAIGEEAHPNRRGRGPRIQPRRRVRRSRERVRDQGGLRARRRRPRARSASRAGRVSSRGSGPSSRPPWARRTRISGASARRCRFSRRRSSGRRPSSSRPTIRSVWLASPRRTSGRVGPKRRSRTPPQALDLAQEHRERGYEAHALRLLAAIEVARETPALDRAEENYRKALALAEELGMRPLQAHCHRGLGRMYAALGPPRAAATAAAAARELYRAMDMTFWLSEPN